MPFLIFFAVIFMTILGNQSAVVASTEIPIHIDELGLATIDLNINGKKEKFILDTGSREGLHLPKEMMRSVRGLEMTGQSSESVDLAGKVNSSERFIINNFQLGDLNIVKLTGVELQAWGLSIDSDGGHAAPGADLPVAGLGLFENYWTMIDYKKAVISVSDTQPQLDAAWVEVDYDLMEEGLAFKLTDGEADYRFVLDSGATSSFIKANVVPKGASLTPASEVARWSGENSAGDNNYWFRPVRLRDIKDSPTYYAMVLGGLPEAFTPDGLLGWDFFESYAVLFNLKKKRLLLKAIE